MRANKPMVAPYEKQAHKTVAGIATKPEIKSTDIQTAKLLIKPINTNINTAIGKKITPWAGIVIKPLIKPTNKPISKLEQTLTSKFLLAKYPKKILFIILSLSISIGA